MKKTKKDSIMCIVHFLFEVLLPSFLAILLILFFGLRSTIWDKHCEYELKERFEIKEFIVSAGGFGSPTLLNIKTTNGENKVIDLYSTYSSMSEIQRGDIIGYYELKEWKIYCNTIRYYKSN